MLSGSEILTLVSDRQIDGLEDHIASLYEIRVTEVTATGAALVSAVAGAALSTVVAMVPATASEDRPVLGSAAIVFAGVLVLQVLRSTSYLAALRSQSEAAKDLVNRLAAVLR